MPPEVITTQEGISIEINAHEAYLWDGATRGLRAYSGPLETVLDIGAHVGCFSLYAAYLGANKIIAVEPFPRNFQRLLRNTMRNRKLGIIVPLEFAVWHEDFKILPLRTAGSTDGQCSLTYLDQYPHLAVRSISFKALLHSFERIDYLKMDIEGGEFEVFERTPEMADLLRNVGFIDIEIHPPTHPHYFSATRFDKENKFFSHHLLAVSELLDFFKMNGFPTAQLCSDGKEQWICAPNIALNSITPNT